jgi:hypothetical protein
MFPLGGIAEIIETQNVMSSSTQFNLQDINKSNKAIIVQQSMTSNGQYHQ